MSFATPIALWLLALLPIVLLLHMFGVRRRSSQVTTARFFQSLDPTEGEPRRAWRHFRPNWLLLLQLIAVACIALALAEPQLTSRAPGYPREVLVIDVSASMRTRDDGGTRFELARNKALAAVDALQPGQQALIVSSNAALHSVFSGDRRRLRKVIEQLNASDRDDDMAATLQLVADLAGDGLPARVRVFTDGAFALPSAFNDALRIEWHSVGTRRDNAGITALSLRHLPGVPGRYQLFVELGNFGTQARSLTFELLLNDVALFKQTVKLDPGIQRSLNLPFNHDRGGVLTARLNSDDALASDDVAHLVLPAPKQRSVELVTAGNLFLEEALRADPANTLNVGDVSVSNADVTVFDGVEPTMIAPGRYLFIRTLPDDAPLTVNGEVDVPPIVDWDQEHSITRYLDLDQVLIRKALNVRATGEGRTLVESPETPLVYTWDDGRVRAVYIGFDLHQSDLRVRAAFPQLIRNAIDWLAPMRLDDLPLAQRADVARDEGLDFVGLHRRLDGETIAVNLLSARESAINSTAAQAQAKPPATSLTNASPQTFARQQPLWRVLGLLALAALIAEAALYMRRRAPARVALVPRGAVVALLIAALWNPSLASSTSELHVAFVVDDSDSVAPLGAAASRKAIGDALAVGVDADSVQRVRFAASTTNSSNIAHAIQRAVVQLPEHGHRRIVLLTDGNETSGDAVNAARGAQRLGVALYPVPIDGVTPAEVRVDALTVPATVRQGEPLILRLRIWSASVGTVQVALHRNSKLINKRTIAVRAGDNVFTFEQTIDEPGYSVFEATISATGDRLEQNNAMLGLVEVRPRPRVLLIESNPNESESLRRLLDTQQIDVQVHGVDTMHSALARLHRFDGLILSNVSSLNFSRDDMLAVHNYVHDQGGGLIMLGGERSFGLGGYYQTPIELALPVTMAVRQKLDVPSISLVLVIDRSGSMNRSDGEFNRLSLAKEAAQRAVEMLSERSEIGVLAFDMKSNWIVPISGNANKRAVLNAIATLQAGGGGTQLMWGLRKAYSAIAQRESVIRHVIILSDGEVYSSKFPELLGNMVDKNITVSAVTIGSKSGRLQMRQISEMGRGRYYYSRDASKLPRIFTMETQLAAKTALVEEPFTPVVRNQLHEVLQGIEWATLPPLNGYIATTPKRSAQTLLTTHHDDPLLALWRYGLGRSAVFTSEFKSRWGRSWMQWKQTNQLVAQLVRWTLRSDKSAEMEVVTQLKGHDGEVRIDVVDRDGQPRNFVNAQALIVTPDQRQLRAPLDQYAPGRYRAHFNAKQSGGYLVNVAMQDDSGSLIRISSRAVQPYPTEYQALTINHKFLAKLATQSSGRVLDDALDVLAEPRPSLALQIAGWPWLLGAALIALVLDLVTRYWLQRRVALAN